MMKLLLGLSLLGLLSSTVFSILVFLAAQRFTRRRRAVPGNASLPFAPPVSLFKPLHGYEPGLEEHLESFFRQDYPEYEILFGARVANDPGLEAARRVASRYPYIPVRFVLTGEPWYINAKVCTLELMERVATHDIFIVSDSDVRVTQNYLREVVAPFADKKVGAVTCLYRGIGTGLWSHLEAAGMSVEMTAGVLVANMMEGMQFTLGPTMAARRICMREMGGFGALGSYCADDFVLGNRIHNNGHTVVLSSHVIDHIVLNEDFVDSQKHQVRWMKSTRFSRPKGHFGTCLTFSVPFGILGAVAALGMHLPLLALILLGYSLLSRIAMAAMLSRNVVHETTWLRTALIFPFRDLLGFFYWAASYAGSTIVWRNQNYTLTTDGLMLPAEAEDDSKSAPAFTS
ncbi:bacteriohopanetetrol glucosamine biosynthesis glycosyltransferase HpnI [Silvibacterium sp.]|uniref:bacteriohopanetetrol glucosamine biosynthesis glycosyltransferase HpnI n=1 Tax=Silvibacterium sp. TaxID=1964179 RepID=UPI0039E57840